MKVQVTNGIVTATAETENEIRHLLGLKVVEQKVQSVVVNTNGYKTPGYTKNHYKVPCQFCGQKVYKRGMHIHIIKRHPQEFVPVAEQK